MHMYMILYMISCLESAYTSSNVSVNSKYKSSTECIVSIMNWVISKRIHKHINVVHLNFKNLDQCIYG